MLIHQLSGTTCAVISPRNRYLLRGLLATLRCVRNGKPCCAPGNVSISLYSMQTGVTRYANSARLK